MGVSCKSPSKTGGAMTNRLGDMVLELLDENTQKQRKDEIVRELNELGDREERYRNILTLRGIVVDTVETPDGSVRIAPGQFALGNGVRPGEGYSGIRMEYPAFEMNGEEWNLAGVEDDTLQFGVRASDGKAIAGAGAIILDEHGLLIPEAGDAFQFRSAQHNQYAYISIRPNPIQTAYSDLELATFKVQSESSYISNGDFETGDFTNWTETDPGGHISVESVDGNYVAQFDNSTFSTDYIQQSLSATASNGVAVTFRAKLQSGSVSNYPLRVTTDAGYSSVYIQGDGWRDYVVLVYGSATYVRIGITTSGTIILDDVVVRPLAGTARSSLRLTLQRVFVMGTSTDYLLVVDTENDRVGIGTDSPTDRLDVNSDTFRLRTSKTPTGTGDGSGNIGSIAWDASYVYVKTGAGWKRAALSTF